jgi:hypothetical protein
MAINTWRTCIHGDYTMAQLSSPGASITVVDESFYTPSAPGTVPLIIVASAENKANAAGTGTAFGTLKANAGQVYLLTSQMDLGSTFGIPHFQTDANNNPINAGELNEYGLQAAYSFLGVSNRAYVVRADLDLAQLEASAFPPAGAPKDKTMWLDTATTNFGIFEWNSAPATTAGGQTFTHKSVTVITDAALISNGAPLASYGTIGDYAVVCDDQGNDALWLKKNKSATLAGTWVKVGSPEWTASIPVVQGTAHNPTLPSGEGDFVSIEVGTMQPFRIYGNNIDALVAQINNYSESGVSAANINGYLALFTDGESITVSGTLVGALGLVPNALGSANYKFNAPGFKLSPHYTLPQFKRTDDTTSVLGAPTGSVWVKTTPVNLGANWVVKKYNAGSGAWIKQAVSQLYGSNQAALAGLDPTGGGINLPLGAVYVKFNETEAASPVADFKVYTRSGVGATNIKSVKITDSTFEAEATYIFTVSESVVGSSVLTSPVEVVFGTTGNGIDDAQSFLTAFTAALGGTSVVAVLNTDNSITIKHVSGGDVRMSDGEQQNGAIAAMFPLSTTANVTMDPTDARGIIGSLWASTTANGVTVAPASFTEPTTLPADQTLWYNSVIDEVDIMVHDGETWVGYGNFAQPALGQENGTDVSGPIVSATEPTEQRDGSSLSEGDIWVSTADLEMYPQIYKFSFLTQKWVLVDNTDQTTENGILFHDARWSLDGGAAKASIADLLTSDFLDFDAPDPALYPKGMLLWNLRRSGNNVLRFVENYVDTGETNLRVGGAAGEPMTAYYPSRWVTEAPNTTAGAGQFGRKAQRAVVVKALNALIEGNQQIRDEDSRVFNLISCPGYLETAKPLVALNMDRGQLSFIVSDSPARLTPDATSLSNWGNNVNNATGDGEDGLITTDANLAVYYPWGYTTDLLGNNIVVPPSHIMLRTIALSDNVSYPWFAPAGTRRGGVTNASSVGYVTSGGEFETVALNTGQRDTLASIHVNPVTYLGGIGLVAYGQKTRQLVASSLDRINVARLVIYLRYQLNQIAKPYIFEPNDTITRNEIKQQIESMLLELTGQRALYDYLVVCDTTNNTPSRIDRNELHVDIAIEPVKAVEFIYIPLRLENTGAIKGLGA